jgi:pyridoxamine 5'-phosphate oxidase
VTEPDLAALRREYAAGGLHESDLLPDPIAMFRRWMHDAVAARLYEPNAMVVGTATPSGVPSVRMVLLKGLDERGLVFYTNYESRKGRELAANPACALLFPWHDLERQVRVEGTASRLTEAENAAYFGTRPRGSQLGAWASPQSQVVADRAALDERYDGVAGRFRDTDVPLPPRWGGFRVTPEAVEFWQGRSGRMHDRLRYRRRGPAEWVVDRLAP